VAGTGDGNELYEHLWADIVKILVVDDHALVRAGLSQVLQGLDANEPTQVLQAAHCAQAFELAQQHPDLDLVLMDYRLPDMTGLDALAILGKKHPDLPVVILSGSANPNIMRQALSQGAAGFVTKSGLSEELLGALRKVLNGGIYEPSHFAAFNEPDEPSARMAPPMFSLRQLDVLRLLLDGFTNREMAERLFVSEETIKTHMSSIMRALGAKTRTQAATEAARWGYRKSSSKG